MRVKKLAIDHEKFDIYSILITRSLPEDKYIESTSRFSLTMFSGSKNTGVVLDVDCP